MLLPLLLLFALPDERTVDADVRAAMRAWSVPGMAVVLVDGDRTLAKGHGVRDVEKDGDVTADTLFCLGSCSKAFTTAALASLVEQKKLDWDDPVRKHLPYFRLADPLADRDVTLRDLLCHRTGLGGHELLWFRTPLGPADSVKAAGTLPLDHGFRSRFHYQSTMYTAAGLAAARAAGTTWDDLIRSRLLTPLGMKATLLDTAAAVKHGPVAAPHLLDGDGRPRRMPLFRWEQPDAAGSVYSTANDLAAWLRFHLSGGMAGKKRLVEAEALKETHTPQIVLRGSASDRVIFPDTVQRSYGLAWVVYDHRGHRLMAHGGALEGHRCHIVFAPGRGVGVAVLSNLHQTPMNVALATLLMERLLGLEPRDWNAKHETAFKMLVAARREARAKLLAGARPDTKPSLPLEDYAGAYDSPAYGRARVTLRGGRLLWRWRDEEGELRHHHDDTFLLVAEPVGVTLVTFTGAKQLTMSVMPKAVFKRAGP